MTNAGASDISTQSWAIAAAVAADAKTDAETVILSVGDLLAITELFVVTSGRTSRQVQALTDEIKEQLIAQGGPKPIRIEGLDDSRWVLMDYGAFVVHVFLDETRAFYDLERLWNDAARVEWSKDGRSAAE